MSLNKLLFSSFLLTLNRLINYELVCPLIRFVFTKLTLSFPGYLFMWHMRLVTKLVIKSSLTIFINYTHK